MKSSIVHKLLGVVTVISDAQEPPTFSEIVKKTGMNKSTIHRLLSIGIEERMIQVDQERKIYLLGPRMYDFVRNAYGGYDIQAIALNEMLRLFELFNANVTIGVLNGLEVVYLRVLESRQYPGGMQQPGMREPVHCSASGKALLAYLPQRQIESKLRGYNFERMTKRTICSATDFDAELEFVRKNGFGKNDREEYDHFLGISAPVFNYVGDPIAVLNIWSVYSHHTMNDLRGWSDELIQSANRVTELIGGVRPKLFDL